MKTIYIAMIPLIALTLLGILLGDSVGSVEIYYERYDPVDRDFDTKVMDFNIDEFAFQLSILIAIMIVITLLGIRILGSGLADSTVRMLSIIILYLGIWAILSAMAWSLLFENAMLGSVIYIFLSLFYIIGVTSKVSGEND